MFRGHFKECAECFWYGMAILSVPQGQKDAKTDTERYKGGTLRVS